MKTGTIPCPQPEGEGFCPETAQVEEIDVDTYECACPTGHRHVFGAGKEPEVTWQEE